MTSQNEVVILFDVDNTLLDNDRVTLRARPQKYRRLSGG